MEQANWNEVVNYIEQQMSKNRRIKGKFSSRNEELWLLKKEMQAVDPSIERVGKTFNEHENADYDTKEVNA